MSAQSHFVFYANASPTIGAGHIMRLLALAQHCLARNIKVTFACQQCPEYLQQRLLSEGFAYLSLPANLHAAILSALNADVLVIDDYYISEAQWQEFIQTNMFLVNIDDNISHQKLQSGLIVNPSITVTKALYRSRTESAVLCLGPAYTMLRQEFAQQAYIPLNERSQLLVSLGGADVKNMSFSLAKALLTKMPKLRITLLLGGLNNSAFAALSELAQQYQQLTIIQQSAHVAPIMMQAGLAISAAGGTLWELASMGTPTIALVSADNQQAALHSKAQGSWYYAQDVRDYTAVAPALLNASNQLNHDCAELNNANMIDTIAAQASELWLDLCKRQSMSELARQFIDTQGCDRIVTRILSSL